MNEEGETERVRNEEGEKERVFDKTRLVRQGTKKERNKA
jgi:hypothetical protein